MNEQRPDNQQLKCPRCGRLFPLWQCTGSLVPEHGMDPNGVSKLCAGSHQVGRNPESDHRPLWVGDKEPCQPTGFGFCSAHPTCDHVTESLREEQVKAAAAVGMVQDECRKSWLEGYVTALTAYAWWKDGEQYVGTCGTTLADAIAQAREGVDASA